MRTPKVPAAQVTEDPLPPNPATRAESRYFSGALIKPKTGRAQDVFSGGATTSANTGVKRSLIGGDRNVFST